MAKKKILKQNGADILPITHESCVLDNNGVPISTKIGSLSQLNTDNKSSLVAAINSISAFNAETKQQLVSALLFKGYNVSSNDSWEVLINKILKVETDEDEGLQMAQGTVAMNASLKNKGVYTINVEFGFVPALLFITLPTLRCNNDSGTPQNIVQNPTINNISTYSALVDWRLSSKPTWTAIIQNLKSTSFDINVTTSNDEITFSSGDIKWYAIGSAPEVKAGGGINVISAAALPNKGEEDQVCVVTSNPVDNVIMTTSDSDITTNANTIYGKLGYGTSDISGTITIGENIKTIYRVDGFFQGGKRQNSYIYQNNTWNQFTKTGISIIRDKAYCTDTQYYGIFPTYTYNSRVSFEMQEGDGLEIYNYSSGYCYYSFIPTAIDISAFNRIVLKWEITSYGNTDTQRLYILGSSTNPGSGRIGQSYTNYTELAYTSNVYNSSNVGTLTADISNMTGTYYIGIGHYYENTGGLYIYDFYLE